MGSTVLQLLLKSTRGWRKHALLNREGRIVEEFDVNFPTYFVDINIDVIDFNVV